MENTVWLTLGYQIPAEPSKNRVYIWRKLKEFGAVYFRPGVALLPKSQQSILVFTKLSKRIIEMGGDATLAELRFIDPADEQRTINEFAMRSQEEYQEIIRDISALRQQATPESKDAQRLARKFKQVRSRDYFMSLRKPEISRALSDLLTDMSHATVDLNKHFSQIMREK